MSLCLTGKNNSKSNCWNSCIFLVILTLIVNTATSQDSIRRNLSSIILATNKASADLAIEKIYLHTDKPAYHSGDTLWFKAYVVDACYLSATPKSGLMYVEIATDSNRVIRRMMAPVIAGMAFGQLSLVPDDIPQGNYVLTAYTNWMRNFREEYIFKKPFYVSAITNKEWLITYTGNTDTTTAEDVVNLQLKMKRLDNSTVSFRDLDLAVADGRRTFFRQRLQSGVNGIVNLQFKMPRQARSNAIFLTMQDLGRVKETEKLSIPLILNRPEQIDLQFLPEGGALVAGLPGRVAFKALNENGYSTPVHGSIVDSKNKEVARFSAGQKGTGIVNLLPIEGEQYTARLQLPGGQFRAYPFPLVSKNGITLQVDNQFASDSCEVTIRCSPEVAASNQHYYLIAEARGLICYGASLRPAKAALKFIISKKTFPSGIVRFTVNRLDREVLNERLIFINHNDHLRIHVTTHKETTGKETA